MTKKYLNVAYKDRDLVKRLGGRWDPAVKRWYCPKGSTLELIFRWRKPAAGETGFVDMPPARARHDNMTPVAINPVMIPAGENFEFQLVS